jgi:hypothetical protein
MSMQNNNENEGLKVGRPSLGVTKKVSITLPEEVWDKLDSILEQSECRSRSELFREILTWFSDNSRH